MLDVITGFAIVFAVIAVGWLLSKRGVIGEGEQRIMFNRVAFYAASPALIFSSVVVADPDNFLSPVVLVISAATVLTSLVYVVASRLFFRMDVPKTTMGASASSYYNSVNIGLPVSLYVLGDATHVVPTLVVQMGLFTPIILGFLGSDSGQGSTRRRVLTSIRTAMTSPVVLAALGGMLIAYLGWTVPAPILAPLQILGGASVPMILMSFGASLTVGGILASDRVATVVSTALKVAGMPLIAWLLCGLFDVSPELTYMAVILSALPTAQNIYNYAATYRRGEVIARDTVFLTTFLSMPAMLMVAFLLGG
ncbi:AEC family transporter [Corynebacterium guangdongense]|uniref:Permease n=1 Tax=Corynebacterium guangdongense TaxID=1783348 RepID=A0ABU1ZU48_9CORY|nr:AEC family transporter [Corynebacterium guangdongense]MDR7328451.1 putative permease [Corynebacterium guangdongense]WJZ17028.1 Membrane transport protein [Corynebacterium guangdongense]